MSNDDEILYRPVLDENTHLGDSHRTEGYKASTVYSDEDGSTVDIAEWEPVYPTDNNEDEGLDELSVAIGALIGAAATALMAFGISKAAPHVQKLVSEHVTPKASSIAQAIKRKIGLQTESETTSLSVEVQDPEEQSQLASAQENESGLVLTESQAEMLLMSAFQDYLKFAAKMRIVGSAQIISETQADSEKLEEARAFLLSSDGLQKINLYLEANPQWFTEETTNLFLELYGRDPIKDGAYLPISEAEFEQTTFIPASDTDSLIKAHDFCTGNRKALESSASCGCFYCLAIYSPSEITAWIEDRNGDTAICSHCGIDAVLPESKEYSLDEEFLQRMQKYWFET